MTKTNAIRLLEQAKVPYDTINYEYDENDLSLSHIAEMNGLQTDRIYKTLVTITSDDEIVVVLVGGTKGFVPKKLAALLGCKKVDMLPLAQLQATTGYIRGGCCPLGMKKKFRTLIDQTAINETHIYVNAGQRGLLFGCAPDALLELCGAEYADIC